MYISKGLVPKTRSVGIRFGRKSARIEIGTDMTAAIGDFIAMNISISTPA